jgi:hypothetical protein
MWWPVIGHCYLNIVPLLFHDLHRLRSQLIPVFEVTLILKDAFSKRGGRRGEEKGDQVGGGRGRRSRRLVRGRDTSRRSYANFSQGQSLPRISYVAFVSTCEEPKEPNSFQSTPPRNQVISISGFSNSSVRATAARKTKTKSPIQFEWHFRKTNKHFR